MRQFTLEFWKDEDWYVGRLLEVPGVFSQGETIEELKKNIQDAYRMIIGSEDVSFIPPTALRISLELAN
jgi:predicted RNase H-like HicB family nuclease